MIVVKSSVISSAGPLGTGIAGLVSDLAEMIPHILDRELGTVEPFRPADEESRDVSGPDRADLSGNGAILVRQEGRHGSHQRWVQFLKILAHKVIQHSLAGASSCRPAVSRECASIRV